FLFAVSLTAEFIKVCDPLSIQSFFVSCAVNQFMKQSAVKIMYLWETAFWWHIHMIEIRLVISPIIFIADTWFPHIIFYDCFRFFDWVMFKALVFSFWLYALGLFSNFENSVIP